MTVVVGYFKGEAFVIGHTTSRAKAIRWRDAHPHGVADEYDYVEVQTSYTLRDAA